MGRQMSDPVTLSVVVCSYNGAEKLTPCFDALARQRLRTEVIVVDDGSTDETAALARSYGFSVIRHERNLGISAARNAGLRNATTSIVAFCDDDCTPPEDWTQQIVASWSEHPGATLIGGSVDVDDPHSFTQHYLVFRNPLRPAEIALAEHPSISYRFLRQFRQPSLPSDEAFPVFSVVGANMSMDRSRALEVGGFDETLIFGEGEDLSLSAAVRAQFGPSSVIVDPRVRLTHRFDPSLAATFSRSFTYGRGAGERWRSTGGWPSIPVVGITAIIVTAAVAPFSWLLALLIGLVILATPCMFWFARKGTERRVAALAYPFVALAQDLVGVAGFCQGVNRSRARLRGSATLRARLPRTKDHWKVVKPTALWLATALVLTIALALTHSPIAPLPGVLTMLLLPGASLLANLNTRPSNTDGRVVLSICLSMTVIMVVGYLASVIGPPIGLAHPLDAIPECVIWFVLALVMLTLGAMKQRDPATWIFDDVHRVNVYGAVTGSVLVLISILGAAQLNHSGNNFLSVYGTGLDVLVLLAGVVGGWKRWSQWPLSTLLYCSSLALLLSTSLRGGHLYGWDVQQEFGVALQTIQHGAWVVPANHDPYASMLSLTVLPAILHSVAKLRLLAFYQLVAPAILALLPVAVFTTIRRVPRWITYARVAPRPGLAFGVTVGLIVSSVAFSSQLVSITRQAMALTMMTALVMVLFDRTMLKRQAQIVIAILLVAISFTHYTTSYLLAAILLCAWVVSLLWTNGWIGTPKAQRAKHRQDVNTRRIINAVLVVVALGAALGWNLAITRNSALTAPANAITTKGAGFATSSNTSFAPPRQLEQLLLQELHQEDSWIVPAAHAGSVKLVAVNAPKTKGVTPSLTGSWSELSYLIVESVWLVLGIALLYGLFRLARQRAYAYSSDLVGLAFAGLLVGAVLRFSGTLAAFYNPERAAIFTAILLAAPVTLFLDDLARLSRGIKVLRSNWVTRAAPILGIAFLSILVLGSTGLEDLIIGGQPPGNLVAKDLDTQNFSVSTPELASAVWLKNNVDYPNTVQSDLYGHLVLLSEPGSYNLLDEIVPPGVNTDSYIYLSTVNLKSRISQASADNGNYIAIYRSNLDFFAKHFYVVYSTGSTRIYH
jgi:uncharacterized membrane protein